MLGRQNFPLAIQTGEYLSCMRPPFVVEFKRHPDKTRNKSSLHRDKTTDKSLIRVKTPDKYLKLFGKGPRVIAMY